MADKGKYVNDDSNSRKILDRLKEYKEFIAIVVFFLGGFMWVFGYFATKDQVRISQCLTTQHIAMVESKMQQKFLLDELTQKTVEFNNLTKNKNTSNKEEMYSVRLKNEIAMIADNLKMANRRYDESSNALKNNACNNPQFKVSK